MKAFTLLLASLLLASSAFAAYTPKTMVTTAAKGGQVAWVRVGAACSSSPCTITSQSGTVTTVTRSGTGTYSIVFAAGTFSTIPSCTLSSNNYGNFIDIPSQTLTQVDIGVRVSAGTAVDAAFSVTCTAAR